MGNGGANLYNTAGAYLLSCQTGNIHRGAASKALSFPLPTDTLITVIYDYPQRMVGFQIGDEKIYVPLTKVDQNLVFYPVLLAGYNMDSATFV